MAVCAMVMAMDADRLFELISWALAGAASAQAAATAATRYRFADMRNLPGCEMHSCPDGRRESLRQVCVAAVFTVTSDIAPPTAKIAPSRKHRNRKSRTSVSVSE